MYKTLKFRTSIAGILILLLTAVIGVSGYASGIKKDIPASADKSDETVKLTALMYHSILKDPSRTGEYVITPETLEDDMIYLKEHGYSSVTSEMLTDYFDKGISLPEKPIMITFDDGHLNNMTYGLEILKKYEMHGIINVVGAFTEQAVRENDPNPYYAYLTWENIGEINREEYIEIGCHTYNMHSMNGRAGASRNSWEDSDSYRKVFTEDIDRFGELIQSSCGFSPTVYAYPFGFISEEGYSILAERGYRIVLSCKERHNFLSTESISEEGIITVDRFNRTGLMKTDEFMEKIGI